MRISKAIIGLMFSLQCTTTQAFDVNDVLNYFASDKEYAAYECTTSANAETCDQTCKGWTARGIVFKLDETKSKLIIRWGNDYIIVDDCAVLDKKNWQCKRDGMVYKARNGKITQTHYLSLPSGDSTYYACFK